MSLPVCRWQECPLTRLCATPVVTHSDLISFGDQVYGGDTQIGEGAEVLRAELPVDFQTFDGWLAWEVANEILGDQLVCRALLGYVSCIEHFIHPFLNERLVVFG